MELQNYDYQNEHNKNVDYQIVLVQEWNNRRGTWYFN